MKEHSSIIKSRFLWLISCWAIYDEHLLKTNKINGVLGGNKVKFYFIGVYAYLDLMHFQEVNIV